MGQSGPRGPVGPKGVPGVQGNKGPLGPPGDPGDMLSITDYNQIVKKLFSSDTNLTQLTQKLNDPRLSNLLSESLYNNSSQLSSIQSYIINDKFTNEIADMLSTKYVNVLKGPDGEQGVVNIENVNKDINNNISKIVNAITTNNNVMNSVIDKISTNNVTIRPKITKKTQFIKASAKTILNEKRKELKGAVGDIGSFDYTDVTNTLQDTILWCADGKNCNMPTGKNAIEFSTDSNIYINDAIDFTKNVTINKNIDAKNATLTIKNSLNANNIYTGVTNAFDTKQGFSLQSDNQKLNMLKNGTKRVTFDKSNGYIRSDAGIELKRPDGNSYTIYQNGEDLKIDLNNQNTMVTITTDGSVIFNEEITLDKHKFNKSGLFMGTKDNALYIGPENQEKTYFREPTDNDKRKLVVQTGNKGISFNSDKREIHKFWW